MVKTRFHKGDVVYENYTGYGHPAREDAVGVMVKSIKGPMALGIRWIDWNFNRIVRPHSGTYLYCPKEELW